MFNAISKFESWVCSAALVLLLGCGQKTTSDSASAAPSGSPSDSPGPDSPAPAIAPTGSVSPTTIAPSLQPSSPDTLDTPSPGVSTTPNTSAPPSAATTAPPGSTAPDPTAPVAPPLGPDAGVTPIDAVDAAPPQDGAAVDAPPSSTMDAAGEATTPLPELSDAAPDIEIWSHVDTFEMAPVVLAADSVYPGNLTVRNGGMADLFNENQALVATNADTVALRFSVDNPNLRIVFTVCESYYRIVARRSAGIETLADLAGKNVSAISQTSAAYFLHRMLATVGLSEADINLNPGGGFGANVPQQMASGALDAVSAWEPDPQRVVDLLGDDAIEFRDRDAYREMVNLNTTAENLADPDKRAAIVALVKTLIVAADQVTNDPESVWPIMEREMGFPQDLIERAWFIQEYKGTLAPDLLDVMVDEEVWLAEVQGRQPRTREQLAPLVDPSILEEALAP